MNTNRNLRKWLRATLIVAFATFATAGTVFASDFGPAATSTALAAPCATEWTAETDIPADVLAEICFLNTEVVGVPAAPAEFAAAELTWVTGSSGIPADVLAEILFLAPSGVQGAPSFRDDSAARFEQYLWAIEQAEEALYASASSAENSAAYFEQYLWAIDQGGTALNASNNFDLGSWEYARQMENRAMSEGR